MVKKLRLVLNTLITSYWHLYHLFSFVKHNKQIWNCTSNHGKHVSWLCCALLRGFQDILFIFLRHVYSRMSCPGESTGKYAPNIFLSNGTDLGLTWMLCSNEIQSKTIRILSKECLKKISQIETLDAKRLKYKCPLLPPRYNQIWMALNLLDLS